jgi:hypothetical protein
MRQRYRTKNRPNGTAEEDPSDSDQPTQAEIDDAVRKLRRHYFWNGIPGLVMVCFLWVVLVINIFLLIYRNLP